MKKKLQTISLLLTSLTALTAQTTWLRINQLGYLPDDPKTAVLISKDSIPTPATFEVCDALTQKTIFQSTQITAYPPYAAFQKSFRLDFSTLQTEGAYYIKAAGTESPPFRIAPDVYDGAADFLLRYMRQQRCGYNPLLNDSCHTAGAYIIYHTDSSKNNTPLPVWGGWHDASDYLQYATTSANAVFQLIFAYQQNPNSFADHYDANGANHPNGVPDVLDEATWGLQWLMKMNPAKNEFYSQIADDRDHRGMRLPNRDTFTYGSGHGLSRPAYFVNGKPQGLFKYQNRTTGVASIAGKYASAFAIGYQTLKNYYPAFADTLLRKALSAYDFGRQYPGVAQTAPCLAPYFYEEDNYADDMELAGVQIYNATRFPEYQIQAIQYGKQEPTTPWMGADTARHYQWYPFLNLGHYLLAQNGDPQFTEYLKQGLTKIQAKGKSNPFLNGVPFIWCSNNLVAAALTQASLYKRLTADTQFDALETALRDWLFGCNPWGTSMVIGLPQSGVSPRDPHSAFTHFAQLPIDGGLVDGPIYGSIFKKLIGLTLYHPDSFTPFQSPLVVYHDDYGDYSTNEPTMDGTASLTYYLSALQHAGASKALTNSIKEKKGAITRLDTTQKTIHLIFTGHDFANGGKQILKTLRQQNIKASFFLTGDFYRNNKSLVKQIKSAGHYLGAHSDKHLLYAPWSNQDSLLLTKAPFQKDLRANFEQLSQQGVEKQAAQYWVPPYEWYNDSIAQWSKEAGLTLINYTPGTSSNADYTTPQMHNYKSSGTIFRNILHHEKTDNNGLNGFILLLHIGTDPARKDKFHHHLNDLIKELKSRGYYFQRF